MGLKRASRQQRSVLLIRMPAGFAKSQEKLWTVMSRKNIRNFFKKQLLFCREGVRLVAHEVAMPRIECQEKEIKPLCIPENCKLKNSNTDCLTTDIPTEVNTK